MLGSLFALLFVAHSFGAEGADLSGEDDIVEASKAKKSKKKSKKHKKQKKKSKGAHWTKWDEVRPSLGTSLSSYGDGTTFIADAGAEYVLGYRYSKAPNWYSESRVGGDLMYGLNSGSFGKRLRARSVIGPDFETARLLFGAELWFDGYGGPEAKDYYLATSMGFSTLSELVVRLGDVSLNFGAAPGWAFNEARKQLGLDEMTFSAGAYGDIGDFRVIAGLERRSNVAGVQRVFTLGTSVNF